MLEFCCSFDWQTPPLHESSSMDYLAMHDSDQSCSVRAVASYTCGNLVPFYENCIVANCYNKLHGYKYAPNTLWGDSVYIAKYILL